jgi:glycosyltransferase 2 family protein
MVSPTRVELQPRWKLWVRYALALAGPVLVFWLAMRSINTSQLWRLVVSASPWWLGAALALKLLTPLGTAEIYARVLRLLGHQASALGLWLTAQIAIVINMAVPAGPVAMSAFLLYVFRRRQVPESITTLAVTLDALTYETAFIGLVLIGLGYRLIYGGMETHQLIQLGGFALAIAGAAFLLWRLQRDREMLTRSLVSAQQWLARRLRRTWRPERIEHFLRELYRGKDLVMQRPLVFAQLLCLQFGVLFLDVLTLYCAFCALGEAPALSVILLSSSLASLFAALAPLPGGGGSYEATLVLTASWLGVPVDISLGATLIYRVLAFWLPVALTVATYRTVLHHPPDGKVTR